MLIKEEEKQTERAKGHAEEAFSPLQLLEALLLLSRIPIQSLRDAMHPTLALSTGRQDIGKRISRS